MKLNNKKKSFRNTLKAKIKHLKNGDNFLHNDICIHKYKNENRVEIHVDNNFSTIDDMYDFLEKELLRIGYNIIEFDMKNQKLVTLTNKNFRKVY